MVITRQQLTALSSEELREVVNIAENLIRLRREDERRQLWNKVFAVLREYSDKYGEICVNASYDDYRISLKATGDYDCPGWLCVQGEDDEDE